MKIDNSVNIYPGGTGALGTDLIKALPRLCGPLSVLRARRRQPGKGKGLEVVVDVATPSGRKRTLLIQVRAGESPARVRETLRRLKLLLVREAVGYPVVASTFLSPRIREICREEGAGYLDLAGNCFLKFQDFYLEKRVDQNPFPRRGRPPSLFSPVSSRVLRALLEEPQRIWKVSELAAATDVSLGQVSNVTRRLIEEEYLTRVDRHLQLAKPGELLDAWREHDAVGQRTRSASPTRYAYHSVGQNPDELMARIADVAARFQWRSALTSFAAALLVAPYVRGIGTVEWYVEEAAAIDGWVSALDLRPVEAGPNVVLRVPYDEGVFYRTQTVQGKTLVGNIQLYLDLWADPARGREQAEFLRTQRIGY